MFTRFVFSHLFLPLWFLHKHLFIHLFLFRTFFVHCPKICVHIQTFVCFTSRACTCHSLAHIFSHVFCHPSYSHFGKPFCHILFLFCFHLFVHLLITSLFAIGCILVRSFIRLKIGFTYTFWLTKTSSVYGYLFGVQVLSRNKTRTKTNHKQRSTLH